MPRNFHLLAAATAIAIVTGATQAHAVVGAFVLADKFFKEEVKKAINTPGHIEWCMAYKPGYRPQWNNWRLPNGRVTYCSSPFYSTPWNPYKE